MFGFDPIAELAHHLEDILDGLRLGRVRARAAARLALIDESGRALRARCSSRLGDGEALAAAEPRIDELAARIQAAREAPQAPDVGVRRARRSTRRCCARSPSTRSTGCARTCGAGATSRWSRRASSSLAFEEGLVRARGRGARGRRGALDAAVAGRVARVADPLPAAGRERASTVDGAGRAPRPARPRRRAACARAARWSTPARARRAAARARAARARPRVAESRAERRRRRPRGASSSR